MAREIRIVVRHLQTCGSSDVLDRMATDDQREAGLDIADFFLTVPTKRQILQQMIRRNPALQLLIDELDLALVE